jgi:hypothetical protein
MNDIAYARSWDSTTIFEDIDAFINFFASDDIERIIHTDEEDDSMNTDDDSMNTDDEE